MVGRYTLIATDGIGERFGLEYSAPIAPRFNIAPSQGVPVVIETPRRRELRPMAWGFQPSWVRADARRPPPINARAETIATNGLFKRALIYQRCLIPADGFYEWVARPGETHKRPMRFRLKSGGLFAFAGIFTGDRRTVDEFATCAIVTTTANRLVAPYHNRMPVILNPADELLWLDQTVRDPEHVLPCLRPLPAEWLEAYEVGRLVSSPFNEGPTLIEPVGPTIDGTARPADSA